MILVVVVLNLIATLWLVWQNYKRTRVIVKIPRPQISAEDVGVAARLAKTKADEERARVESQPTGHTDIL